MSDLKPSVHVHKRFGKNIEVRYYQNEPSKECSLTKEICIEEGTRSDYDACNFSATHGTENLADDSKVVAAPTP